MKLKSILISGGAVTVSFGTLVGQKTAAKTCHINEYTVNIL